MDVRTPERHARPFGFGRVPLAILDLGVFAGTFLFRWLTVEFPNDHFQHLSRLRQILYLTLLVPVVALGLIGADCWSGRVPRPDTAVVVAAAILCGIISHTLVRDDPGARLADVAAPTFVLAAWLPRGRTDPGGSLVRARLKRTAMVSVLLVTSWSLWTVGGSDASGGGSTHGWGEPVFSTDQPVCGSSSAS